jgi:hypothetical protein
VVETPLQNGIPPGARDVLKLVINAPKLTLWERFRLFIGRQITVTVELASHESQPRIEFTYSRVQFYIAELFQRSATLGHSELSTQVRPGK